MTGKELKAARKAKGIRQLELMRMLGLRSKGCVSEWERGKFAIPPKHHSMLRRLLDMPKTSTPNPTTGAQIKAARRALGLSQREVGRRVGVTHPTVAAWELGRSHPHPRHRAAVRALLGITDSIVPARSLRDARLAAGLTQCELAERIGMKTGGPVSLWESGLRKVPAEHMEGLRRELGPYGYSAPAAKPAPAPRTEETLRALRIRAWELGCTVSTAGGRFTVYRARLGSPVRKLKSYTTQTGAALHIDRLEAATEMMAAA